MTISTDLRNDVQKLASVVDELYDEVGQMLESDKKQSTAIAALKIENERLKAENDGLKEIISGPHGVMERLASLHEVVNKGGGVIRGIIESISGIPATLKLKDGTAWKLNHFLFMNFHIWGWKQGDKVKITENESRFSTMGPYIIQNLSRGGTSSGYPLSDV